MKTIDEIPPLPWGERALKQMQQTDPVALIAQSRDVFQLGRVAVVGLVYQSLLQAPWLWMALADNITMRDLIDFRRLQERIPVGTQTGIEAGDAVAIRFAEFYGFVRTERVLEQDGMRLLVLEKQ